MRNARIVSTGVGLAERVVTNQELSKMLGEDIDNFVSGTLGIKERRILTEGQSTADLATAAAEKALERAKAEAEELDLIILATDTPEYISPATSVVVQHRLGASRAGTFDINAACAGFVTALDTACKYIAADERYKKVLVIGAYAMSRFLDWKEKKTATIFADGAGAVLLEASREDCGLIASRLAADGKFHDYLGIFAGGAKFPITEEELACGYRTKVRFAKKYPPEVNIQGWQKIVRELLDDAGLKLEDISLYLFTQVNKSTIEAVVQELGLGMEKTHTIMEKWGYTGSACIPMALDDAISQGKLKRGEKALFCVSGGGLNMAAMIFKY